MGFVVDRIDTGSRCIHLKDDWSGSTYKIVQLDSSWWTGYEDDIQVMATDSVAIVTRKDGAIRQFDLSQGSNIAVEI